MNTTLDLDALILTKGAHKPGDQMGVLEAVAMLANEPWSDHPQCASPVIGTFLRSWNDALPDDQRQTLKRHIPGLVGSRGTAAQETERSWMALDWLVRIHAPAWLRLAGLTIDADALATLAPITLRTVHANEPLVQKARLNAAAAWDAARDAAGDAAGAAAGDAARDAAWAAAGDALASTVTDLQESAHDLVTRMIAITDPS